MSLHSGADVVATAIGTASLPTIGGLSVIGNTSSASAQADGIAGTRDQIFRVAASGTSLGFGAINLSTSAAVTGRLSFANVTALAGLSVLGNTSTAATTMAAITGTIDQVLVVNTPGTGVVFGQVNLSTSAAVTGTLGVAFGGTGATTASVAAANLGVTGNGTASVGQLPGTATNDSANAGNVGQIVSASIAANGVTLSTGTDANVTSIALTAGDWDVYAVGYFHPAAATTVTSAYTSISNTSATVDATNGNIARAPVAGVALGTDFTVTAGPARVSQTGTVTYYLVANAAFGVSTCSAYGIIRARRAR